MNKNTKQDRNIDRAVKKNIHTAAIYLYEIIFTAGMYFAICYSYLYLIIPYGLGSFCQKNADLILKKSAKPMIPAIAIQIGHSLSILIAIALNSVIVDRWEWRINLGIILVSLIWLAIEPVLKTVTILTIAQVAMLVINFHLLFQLSNIDSSKALVAIITFQILAIVRMFEGLKNTKVKFSS